MPASATIRLDGFGQTAEIAPLGAEIRSWTAHGRPLLWQPDAAVWPATCPVLFPIVGRAAGGAIRVDGRRYPIGIHGFAAASRFEPVEAGAAHARFVLADDAATRQSFPFAFRLDVYYRLDEGGLAASFRLDNPGRRVLPYALGLHPGFRWPFSGARRDGHRIVFEHPERPAVPVITADGLFSPDSRPVPLDGTVLPLDDALMAREALCFLDTASSRLRFEAPDGAAIMVETEDFPHLALWARPPAPFLSIEAWTGHGDPQGFRGELADKPSMRLLAPGASARHAMRWRFDPR